MIDKKESPLTSLVPWINDDLIYGIYCSHMSGIRYQLKSIAKIMT